jgi:hypothetical protein
MVAIVENWSDLSGTVREVATADAGGLASVVLDVDKVAAVAGYKNLLDEVADTTVRISVRDDALRRTELKPGDHVVCRTRTAGPGRLFAHPDHPEVTGGS